MQPNPKSVNPISSLEGGGLGWGWIIMDIINDVICDRSLSSLNLMPSKNVFARFHGVTKDGRCFGKRRLALISPQRLEKSVSIHSR